METIRASIPLPRQSERGQKQSAVTKLALCLWALFPLLFPVYLFDPGRPQIASFLMVVTLVVVAVNGLRFPRGSTRILGKLAWFIWYVCLVNLTWVVWTKNFGALIVPVFYVFNALAFIVMLSLYAQAGKTLLRVTQHAVATSVFLNVVVLLLKGSAQARASLFFDNPNQLGYFALVSAALFLAIADKLGSSRWYRGAVLSACIYLVLMSSSFAAVAGLALIIILVLRRRPVLALIALVAVPALVALRGESLFIDERFEGESAEWEETSFLAGRGYDRIIIYPEQIILGAGEGNYRQYRESAAGKHEIHSSFGTLLFSYGIVGSLLFGFFLWCIASRGGVRCLQYLVPVLLFGFAHQGLRSTMLWVFLAMLWCLGDQWPRLRPQLRASQPSNARSVAT